MKNKLFLVLISMILIFSTLCFFACGKHKTKANDGVKRYERNIDQKRDDCPDCKNIDDGAHFYRKNGKRAVPNCPDCE